MADVVADIGVLGSSGLYALLADARTVELDTPYGAPSAPLVAEGPRFSTRAESKCFWAQGWSVVGGLHPDPALP